MKSQFLSLSLHGGNWENPLSTDINLSYLCQSLNASSAGFYDLLQPNPTLEELLTGRGCTLTRQVAVMSAHISFSLPQNCTE